MITTDTDEKKVQKSAYDEAIKYTGLFGGVQGLTLLTSLVRNKLVSELLGPMGLGFISMYNTTVTMLSNVTNFGISFSAVRHVSEAFEADDRVGLERFVQVIRVWGMATALLGMVVCFLLAPLLSFYCFDTLHRWADFCLLAPVVGLMTLSGGELAILKGVRCLRSVALQSVVNAFCSIILTIPLYYIWGMEGILPALILLALSTLGTIVWFSSRLFPFRFSFFSREIYKQGLSMVKLGIAFVLAGILGSGAEFVIRAFLFHEGGGEAVGLYNAAYAVTVTYASMVFVAMETDYFPRLSAVNRDVSASNTVVGRQIVVSLLLVSPLLAAFLVFLPLLLPLLYSSEFLPVIGMAQFAIFSMYFRAMAMPISYLSLAKGRAGIYLFAESVYDVCVVLFIVVGYLLRGLSGAGVALALASLVDLLTVWLTCRKCYGFRLPGRIWGLLALQIGIAVAAFAAVRSFHGIAYWTAGVACIGLSASLSAYVLYRETNILQKIVSRIVKKRK